MVILVKYNQPCRDEQSTGVSCKIHACTYAPIYRAPVILSPFVLDKLSLPRCDSFFVLSTTPPSHLFYVSFNRMYALGRASSFRTTRPQTFNENVKLFNPFIANVVSFRERSYPSTSIHIGSTVITYFNQDFVENTVMGY